MGYFGGSEISNVIILVLVWFRLMNATGIILCTYDVEFNTC